jgi:hypothetical protein
MSKIKLLLLTIIVLLTVTGISFADLTPPSSSSVENDAAYIRQDGTTTLSTSMPFEAGIMGEATGHTCSTPTTLVLRLPLIGVNDTYAFTASLGDQACFMGTSWARVDMDNQIFSMAPIHCDLQELDMANNPQYDEETSEITEYTNDINLFAARTFDVFLFSMTMGEETMYGAIAAIESEIPEFSSILNDYAGARPTFMYKIDNFLNWNSTTCSYEAIPAEGTNMTECTANCQSESAPTFGATEDVWEYLVTECSVEMGCSGENSYDGSPATITEDSVPVYTYVWSIDSSGEINTDADVNIGGDLTTSSIEVGDVSSMLGLTSNVTAVTIITDSSDESPFNGTALSFQANVVPTEDTWDGLAFGLYGGMYLKTAGVSYEGTMGAMLNFLGVPGSDTEIAELTGVANNIVLDSGSTGLTTLERFTGFSNGIVDITGGNSSLEIESYIDFSGTYLYLANFSIDTYYGLKIQDNSANNVETHYGIYNEDNTYLKTYVGIGDNSSDYETNAGRFLHIAGTLTDAVSYQYGQRINITAQPSSDPTSFHAYAMDTYLNFAPTFASEGAYLYGGQLNINTDSHLTCAAAVHPTFTFGEDTVADIDSFHIFRAWMPSAMDEGHIDDLTGVSINGPTLTGTATVGQIYGIAISDLVGGTGIPYGIYISNFTDAGGYGIYSVPPIATENALTVGYLDGIPSSPANGMIWMESDGLHIYYNGSEQVVEIVTP